MIPTEFEQITADWMTTAIGEPDGVVESVRWERIAEGVGLLGRLARFELTWSDPPSPGDTSHSAERPASVIVKLPSQIPEMVEQAMMFGFYDREINFYRQIGDTASVRVPHIYMVDADEAVVPFVLVMEDLRDSRVVDQLEGCELSDSLKVAKAAARLHATYWGKQSDLDAHTWLPAVDGPLYSAAGPLLVEMAPVFLEGWADRLPEGSIDLATSAAKSLNELQRRATQDPLTMCHYDLRLDNLLFNDADDDVCVIDFQLMGTQRGPYDLAYFIGWSLTPQQRREQTAAILDAYVAELEKLGVQADRQWVDDVFRESMLGVVCMAVLSGATAVVENERGEQLVAALVERAFASAHEVNAAEFLP